MTDFIARWWWLTPAPAFAPGAGLACLGGWFGSGLLGAWLVTFLDNVDRTLARVTVSSSRLGNLLDHGLDLIRPSFWYAVWALGLPDGNAPTHTLI